MSEHVSQNPNTNRYIKRGVVGLSALALLAGGVTYGPEACGAAQDKIYVWSTDESDIVAGVPGQIETYDHDRVWTGKFYTHKYYLAIEQCPTDLAAAVEGNSTNSFNPEVGVVNQGCNYDWVRVSSDTYSNAVVGQTISFQGDLGEHLRK